MEEMKACTKCGEIKPVGEFHRRTRSRDGLTPQCKACAHQRSLADYGANRDRRRQAQERWRADNREHVQAKRREWAEQNPERAAFLSRRSHLQTRYGLTPEAYDSLLAAQGGVCAICGEKPSGERHRDAFIAYTERRGINISGSFTKPPTR
jgi:hypothetical protein